MDIENAKSWAKQPDVCRCCLATNGSWDVTASYINTIGINEVFSDMIQECFGFTLSHLTDWGPSRLICSMCLSRLRDATTFRKQVLLAEKQFVQIQNNNDVAPVFKSDVMKCETICHLDRTDGDSNHEDTTMQDFILESHSKTNSANKLTCIDGKRRKKCKKNAKFKKRKITKVNTDCDSDAPISELNLKLSEIRDKMENIGNTENDGILHENVKNVAQKVISVKQLSERKRVIMTCNIVLNDTNACPFRHHKSWFQCFFCAEEFMEINLLRDHNTDNHTNVEYELKKLKRYPRSLQIDITTLKCINCCQDLKDVQTMKEHFLSIHKKVIYNECIADYKVNASPYICHICKQEFHVFRSLTTHINEHYANCICDVCGKSFINTKRLKVHKRTHEKGHFPCKECGKVLKTKTSKANHVESAHCKRTLKCQICLEPMKHYNDRIKHMSEVHDITHKFKCHICSKVYNIKHYLATHLRQTHGHKNKKCQECSMAFITNHGLKKHMLKHTGEKPFSCDVCSKAYARNYTLREHMKVHDNDRRFFNDGG